MSYRTAVNENYKRAFLDTWDANSSFLSLNNSEQSLSVVLHVVIERYVDLG